MILSWRIAVLLVTFVGIAACGVYKQVVHQGDSDNSKDSTDVNSVDNSRSVDGHHDGTNSKPAAPTQDPASEKSPKNNRQTPNSTSSNENSVSISFDGVHTWIKRVPTDNFKTMEFYLLTDGHSVKRLISFVRVSDQSGQLVAACSHTGTTIGCYGDRTFIQNLSDFTRATLSDHVAVVRYRDSDDKYDDCSLVPAGQTVTVDCPVATYRPQYHGEFGHLCDGECLPSSWWFFPSRVVQRGFGSNIVSASIAPLPNGVRFRIISGAGPLYPDPEDYTYASGRALVGNKGGSASRIKENRFVFVYGGQVYDVSFVCPGLKINSDYIGEVSASDNSWHTTFGQGGFLPTYNPQVRACNTEFPWFPIRD